MWKFDDKEDIYEISQVFLTRYLLINKRKHGNLIVEKTRHHPNQIKLVSPGMEQIDSMSFWKCCAKDTWLL